MILSWICPHIVNVNKIALIKKGLFAEIGAEVVRAQVVEGGKMEPPWPMSANLPAYYMEQVTSL